MNRCEHCGTTLEFGYRNPWETDRNRLHHPTLCRDVLRADLYRERRENAEQVAALQTKLEERTKQRDEAIVRALQLLDSVLNGEPIGPNRGFRAALEQLREPTSEIVYLARAVLDAGAKAPTNKSLAQYGCDQYQLGQRSERARIVAAIRRRGGTHSAGNWSAWVEGGCDDE